MNVAFHIPELWLHILFLVFLIIVGSIIGFVAIFWLLSIAVRRSIGNWFGW